MRVCLPIMALATTWKVIWEKHAKGKLTKQRKSYNTRRKCHITSWYCREEIGCTCKPKELSPCTRHLFHHHLYCRLNDKGHHITNGTLT